MSKILVTGGAGFIGYHLIKELIQQGKNEIHVVDNLSRGRMDSDFEAFINNSQIEFIHADLTDLQSFSRLDLDYDFIYHLAAVIGVKNVINNPDKVLHVNIVSTLNLFEWVKNNHKHLKKILFSSTSEVYAGTMKHYGVSVPTDETVNLTVEDITSPRTTYGLSKIIGESVCFSYYKKYNIPITIVRYHNVYGPRMGFAHVIPELMIRAYNAKDCLEIYSPNHSRAFCYIDDAVQATIKLAESKDSTGHIVNVGNSENEVTIDILARKIIELINPTLKIRYMDVQEGSTRRRCPNTEKLIKLTQFRPRIPINLGIQLTWNWYKNNVSDIYE
ncbi:MAG: NAD-dependent epimerase/dehydratase family protein [Candidatus Methanoperedens sp.]|nr:NAD-dependent epimerase/dehydratase family protein [Candidatus Methanoperedens sp.]MCZ7396172.1 NAD-dependent epimerase/dehydratase family protein [Candidatus Methanoperedens sp.]